MSSTGGEGGQTTLEHDILNALVVESCVGVLGKVYRAGECGRSGDECCPDTLKRLRFERMLGEYHALMREEAMAGAGGAGVLEASRAFLFSGPRPGPGRFLHGSCAPASRPCPCLCLC